MEHSPYSKAPLALVLVDLTDMEDPVGLADLVELAPLVDMEDLRGLADLAAPAGYRRASQTLAPPRQTGFVKPVL
jgi:hypothetical protein